MPSIILASSSHSVKGFTLSGKGGAVSSGRCTVRTEAEGISFVVGVVVVEEDILLIVVVGGRAMAAVYAVAAKATRAEIERCMLSKAVVGEDSGV